MNKITNNKEYTEKYDSSITNAINEAQSKFYLVHTQQYELYKPYCDKLFMLAVQEQSDYLFALAYYYMMEYSAADNDHINTISCALEGVKYQQHVHEHELAARSYNVLGVFTGSMGDRSKAVEYFLCSIDLCNTYHLDYIHCIAAMNLADVFSRSSNYERSLFYYQEAEKYYMKSNIDKSEECLDTLILLLCSKGYCHLSIHQMDEANKCCDLIKAYLTEITAHSITYPIFFVNTYFATLAYTNGEMELMSSYLELAKRDFHSADNYVSFIDYIISYIDLYMRLERYDEVTSILNYYLTKCENDHAPFNIYSSFMEIRIDCALKQNNMDDYIEYTQKFFELYKNERTCNSESTIQAERAHKEGVLMQKQQYEMHLLNERLLLQSQHDTLTGLSNRAYMNSYAEETLAKALKNKVPFGIEILDIDFFKHINDNYGHMTGDRYLTAVSEILQKIADEFDDTFVARYGGDEFVIVYYNKTNEQIIDIMDTLKAYTCSIKLPDVSILGYDHVTLSQGCFNRIPQEQNRLWDFLSVADTALYDVKQAGKNSYSLQINF